MTSSSGDIHFSYADDMVLISDSIEGRQRQLNSLHAFCIEKDRTVNLGKTTIMIFNTSYQVASKQLLTYKGNTVEIATSYAHLGVSHDLYMPYLSKRLTD